MPDAIGRCRRHRAEAGTGVARFGSSDARGRKSRSGRVVGWAEARTAAFARRTPFTKKIVMLHEDNSIIEEDLFANTTARRDLQIRVPHPPTSVFAEEVEARPGRGTATSSARRYRWRSMISTRKRRPCRPGRAIRISSDIALHRPKSRRRTSMLLKVWACPGAAGMRAVENLSLFALAGPWPSTRRPAGLAW